MPVQASRERLTTCLRGLHGSALSITDPGKSRPSALMAYDMVRDNDRGTVVT